MIELDDIPYTTDEADALGILVDHLDGYWLVPYPVMFPIGSTLDWITA